MSVKYWAIDYVNKELEECELVCDDQLYATEEEAYAAIKKLPHPELYEVDWYGVRDLQEIFDNEDIEITSELKVIY